MKQIKGQVTLFVIIGAIILLAAGMFFFVNKELSEKKPTIDIPDVSLEVRPVKTIVETCLRETSKEVI